MDEVLLLWVKATSVRAVDAGDTAVLLGLEASLLRDLALDLRCRAAELRETSVRLRSRCEQPPRPQAERARVPIQTSRRWQRPEWPRFCTEG